nr:MAG: major capsid protein [Microvirus sp.]
MFNVQSVMSHNFSQVPHAEIPRSSFNRSCGHKTTFDAGYLIPIFIDEALPGDTFNLKMTAFSRLATSLFPYMDNMFMDSFFFAVPYRLVWDNWQKFNGEQRNPTDSTDFLVPQMVSPVGGYAAQSMSDYFGLPTNIAGLTHSSLFHRSYNLIYNEWFRDENLQVSVPTPRGDGPDSPSDFVLLRRGKRHDYFTSCLPWPQKGPSVQLPLGATAPVVTNNQVVQYKGVDNASRNFTSSVITGTNLTYLDGTLFGGPNSLRFGAQTGLQADLSAATAATINQIRQAFQIQKLYERDARGGTRYTEIIRSHFGVVSPDARLQRPEYLGGGSSPVSVQPVPQTSSTDSTSPQANLAAYGTSTLVNHGFTKSFTEHCLIIGLVSVRADLNYQQGLNRMFSRRTRWDFYWPALSHIGEQAVLNKEIYAQGTAADNNVFGYQERYAEYRYKPSQISGQFRSNFAQTLDSWHLAQNFGSLPTLNSTFIQENPPVDRIKALGSDYPDFISDMFFDLKCARPMPVYSVPGLIDHF